MSPDLTITYQHCVTITLATSKFLKICVASFEAAQTVINCTHVEHIDKGEVFQFRPLLLNVVHVTNDYDGLEFTVEVIASTQWHNKTEQTHRGSIHPSYDAGHNVTLEYVLMGFAPTLYTKSTQGAT
jgi:hypothetical protein